MTDATDSELMQDFADRQSEAAFAQLVQRHINLAYSVALRFTGHAEDARDVTQAVFIVLARKASSLRQRTTLTGWLYETTRLTARQSLRTRARQFARDQEAYMQSHLNELDNDSVWRQLAPQLEQAMSRLNESERALLALRFFENKTGEETASLLGIGADAAHKRTARAVEKLRGFFTKRGVTLTATVLTAAISANSVQAAPLGLAATVTATAAKGAVVSGSTLTLIKGALKIMAWTKAKMAIAVGVGVLLAAGTATVVVEKTIHPKLSSTDISWADDPKYWELNSEVMRKLPPVLMLRPTRFPNDGGSVTAGYSSVGKNMSLRELISRAYNHSFNRMVTPRDLPQGGFDLMLTLTNPSTNVLAEEIKKQFGITAHLESREADVLLLKVRTSDAPDLKISTGEDSSMFSGSGKYKMTGARMNMLASHLESRFSTPVLDRTELTNSYDASLTWMTPRGQISKEQFKQLLLDQLGLELVPSREKIEMLVIEKVK